MDISEEIKQVAQVLGQSLKNHSSVQTYLDTKAQTDSDPEIVDLEQRLEKRYLEISAREKSGESLFSLASDEFFTLRSQIRYHPLITARENQLMAVKDVFSQAGSEMKRVLGVDYATLVSKSE